MTRRERIAVIIVAAVGLALAVWWIWAGGQYEASLP